ncbi:hypothetical protein QE250_00100 [Chromatiaceae bacterium AAb-1]|nr:hypothetical protein [Chromatiaceae bacterium AAb-1]
MTELTPDASRQAATPLRPALILLAVASFLLALAALAAVLWQGHLLQQQQALLIQPRLELERKDDGIYYEYFIKNHGMGPAQVTRVDMFVDGEVVTDWQQLVGKLGEKNDCFGRGRLTRFFQPQDKFLLFKNLNQQCYKNRAEQERLWQRINMTIWYQSLAGDQYHLTLPVANVLEFERE